MRVYKSIYIVRPSYIYCTFSHPKSMFFFLYLLKNKVRTNNSLITVNFGLTVYYWLVKRIMLGSEFSEIYKIIFISLVYRFNINFAVSCPPKPLFSLHKRLINLPHVCHVHHAKIHPHPIIT